MNWNLGNLFDDLFPTCPSPSPRWYFSRHLASGGMSASLGGRLRHSLVATIDRVRRIVPPCSRCRVEAVSTARAASSAPTA